MPLYRVRNRTRDTTFGEVVVDDPAKVLDALAYSMGCKAEDIIMSLGNTAEEAKAALEIVEVAEPGTVKQRAPLAPLPRQSIYGGETCDVLTQVTDKPQQAM